MIATLFLCILHRVGMFEIRRIYDLVYVAYIKNHRGLIETILVDDDDSLLVPCPLNLILGEDG